MTPTLSSVEISHDQLHALKQSAAFIASEARCRKALHPASCMEFRAQALSDLTGPAPIDFEFARFIKSLVSLLFTQNKFNEKMGDFLSQQTYQGVLFVGMNFASIGSVETYKFGLSVDDESFIIKLTKNDIRVSVLV